MARFMYGGFQGLNDRLDGLDYRFEGLQLTLHTHMLSPDVERGRLLDWLKAVFTDDEFEAALSSQTPGTCKWITQRRQYRDWENGATAIGSTKILWIRGPPGFGKTVLCASLVQSLQVQTPARVAHFFCVSEDETKRQPLAIVRSWVAQIISQNLEAVEAARKAYHGKDGRSATTSDVWQLFRKICQRIPNCTFIVDGFDECVKFSGSPKFETNKEGFSFVQRLTHMASEMGTACGSQGVRRRTQTSLQT